MAFMIPDISPSMIDNHGERLIYSSLLSLPSKYTVLYSYKYKMEKLGVGMPTPGFGSK